MLKLNIQLNYLPIYNYIIKEIENNSYVIFDGIENIKTNPISRHIPMSNNNQTISLCSKNSFPLDLTFKDCLDFESSNDYLYFELILNGFKEKYNTLNDVEIEVLKKNLLSIGVFFESSNNAVLIGLNKNLL